MIDFRGTWEFLNSSNVDNYLKFLGVGLVFRKVVGASKPTLTLSRVEETNQWAFSIATIYYTQEIVFKLNETTSDDETLDGRPCKTIVCHDKKEKCLVLTQTPDEGPEIKITLRKLDDGSLTMSHVESERKISCEFTFQPVAGISTSYTPHAKILE